jgi:hypothetical protein
MEMNRSRMMAVAVAALTGIFIMALTGVVYATGYAGFESSASGQNTEPMTQQTQNRASHDRAFVAQVACDDLGSEEARALHDCS